MNTEEKITSREKLKKIIEILRKEGKKIGFTCGAFDLLHAGHVQYLEEAKEICDVLVVAVNTDESVHMYKGVKRPINPEQERMRLVAGLEAVDYVTPLTERRPRDLIALLQPDYYFKGGDYAADELQSKDILGEWGGEAVILPLTQGRSTSTIIDRIVQLELTECMPQEQTVQKAVFLDRDGTINKEIPFLHEPGKFQLLPNAATGLKKIQDLGYRLIIVTNQQGIGLGYFPVEDFFQVNSAMFRALALHSVVISKIYFCPHSAADECDCRKPGIGLIKKAEKDLNLDLNRCYFIGDKPEDVEAGHKAGCKTILIRSKTETDTSVQPTFTVTDLLEAAEIISKETE
ncbi:MAG: HAD-IIIA family hydrolase [Gemmatimonadota bacterium]|nr:MAG: HAD-IIIA family hydrolase [Gemmatimonadota bacterium]